MLNKKNITRLFLGLFLAISFVYGLVVGTYQIFPFNEIRMVKNFVSGEVQRNKFDYPYYLDKTSFFKLHSRSDYDVVFIGDSITDHSDWYDIFPSLKVANRGIGADTTAGVLNRMDTIKNTGAGKAFLMVGINDINQDVDVKTIFNNYKEIINELKKNNIEPFVQSTLLTNTSKINNEIVNKLNSMLVNFCNENNVVFIDLNHLLSKSGRLNKDYSSDGVHINGEAYSIWSKAIEKYVY